MESGKLRHRISIGAPATGQDQYGEPVEGWTPVAEAWAEREDLSGRELFVAQQVAAEITTRFKLRHIAGLTAKQRLLLDGEAYDIKSVADPDGRRRTLIILAARVG